LLYAKYTVANATIELYNNKINNKILT